MPATFWVLAHAGDRAANAVATLLADRHGPGSVRSVTAEALTVGRWAHQSDGAAFSGGVWLSDGTAVAPPAAAVVLNRIEWAPPPPRVRAADHDYAAMETFALWLSWLQALPCPVVNPPTPQGLAGARMPRLRWLALAAAAGIPATRVRLTTDPRRFPTGGARHDPATVLGDATALDGGPAGTGSPLAGVAPPQRPPGLEPAVFAPVTGAAGTVLVAGSRVVGAPDEEAADICRRLAAAAGTPLLAVHLTEGKQGWQVDGGNPLPALAHARELAAVTALLESLGAGGPM